MLGYAVSHTVTTVVKFNMSVPVVAGLLFKFTYVKMKGPNKLNLI